MYILFFISVIGLICAIPIHFLSLEHKKIDKKYGEEKGRKISATLGRISAYLVFFCFFGLWFSPQPRFIIPILRYPLVVPLINFTIYVTHILISLPFVILYIWIMTLGVKGTSRKTAETHRAEKVAKTGIYSIVRHPQHLAHLLGYIGMIILFSGMYSLIFFHLRF